MTRVRLWGAIAIATLLLGGCVFGGGDGEPEVTASVTVVATSEATVVATSEATGVATSTNSGGSISRLAVGLVVIDVDEGAQHAVYEDRRLFWPGDSFFPQFASDGSLWVPVSGNTAVRRFSTELGWTDEIEDGGGVSSSTDGRQLAYYRRGADGLVNELVIEGAGRAAVVPGAVLKHEFSRNGAQVAYYLLQDDNSAELHVIDLMTGDSRLLATDIDPCACDWTPGPTWAPSGDYLAYRDHGGHAADHPDGGSFVVRAVGGEPVRTLWSDGWLPGAASDQLLVGSSDQVGLYEVGSGELRPFVLDADGRSFWDPVLVGQLPFVQVVSEEADRERLTWLVDGRTGEPAASWPALGVSMMTAVGPLIAIDSATAVETIPRSCAGVSIVDAALDELECVEGASGAVWSPDGRYLGMFGRDDDAGWAAVWSPTDGLVLRFDIPRPVTSLNWNETRSEILVTWGWSPL